MTEKKQGGVHQHNSENIYKAIFENSIDAMLITTPDGGIQSANPAACRLFGRTEDEIIKGGRDCLIDLSDDRVPLIVSERKRTGSFKGEVNHKRKDGTIFLTEISTSIFKDTEGRDRSIIVIRDLTDKKLVEEAIAKSEENLYALEQQSRAWLENSPMCTKIVDLDFNLQFMSSAGFKGLQIDDITPYYGKPYPFHFYPWAFKTKMSGNMIKAIETGAVITQEAPVVDINGNEVWFHSTIIPVKDLKGKIDYLLIVSLDTTEKKHAEETLIQNQILLKSSIESLQDNIFLSVDKNYCYLAFNSAHWKAMNYAYNANIQLGGNTLGFISNYDDRIKAKECYDSAMSGKSISQITIYGEENPAYYESFFNPIYNDKDEIIGATCLSRNISERKQVEKKLIESEEKYRLLSEQSDVGVGLYSTEGIALYFNHRALKNLGGNLEDYVGKSQTDLFGKKAGTKYFNRIKEVIRLQKTLVFEDPFESPSGKYWFSSNHSIIRDSKGVVVGIQVVAIDITQRKNFEEQLIKSAGELQDLTRHLLEVREEERTSIARDLHDDLGQKLTALNMDLTWLKTRIGVQSRPVESKFQQMTSLLNETIGSIQKISYGLRPSILDDLGLIAAIEWQLIDFNKNSGLSCSFSCSPNDVSVNSIISLAVFRIIQEALTNIARHSGATKVKIKISLTQGILEVLIRDNGSGIDPKKIESSKSFGLIGMRERVRVVSGEVSIRGIKGEGTSVLVRIPTPFPPSR